MSVETKVGELTQLTMAQMAAGVASGDLTPLDLVRASLDRIEQVEPRVKAWTQVDRERALADAETLTAEAKAGRLRGPLHGVPVGVKDEFHVAGLRTEMAGDASSRERDATAVARLRAAGAVILGKTTMPIEDRLPPTRNPWNLEHTAGGTSSGSGAAVGARMVPFALGEQTAGSNLRPAAFCGVAGLKPTFGRISRDGCFQFSYSHDHVGLIGLTMADLALALSVVAGPDPRDRTAKTIPAPPSALDPAGIRPPRIGLVRNFFPERTGSAMQRAVEASAERLRAAGAPVVDLHLPNDFGLVWMVHRLVGGAESATFRARRLAEGTARRTARDLANSLIPGSYYLHAQRVRHYLWQRVQRHFADVDLLLMAVAPEPAPKGTGSTGDASLLVPWSCLGYPAITLNGGLSPENLPLGLQLVGPPFSEPTLLAFGTWCEHVLGRLPAPTIAV